MDSAIYLTFAVDEKDAAAAAKRWGRWRYVVIFPQRSGSPVR